jgi:hypothetical protein
MVNVHIVKNDNQFQKLNIIEKTKIDYTNIKWNIE